MKKTLIAGVAFAAFVVIGPAVAADLLKAPAYVAPVAVSTVYNWTGFYVGGNAGYAWGQQNTALSILDSADPATCHFCGTTSDVPGAQGAGSPSFNPKGFTGGGQFGYNLQASNWVYGIEVDFGAFDQRQTINNGVSLSGLSALNSPFPGGVCSSSATCAGNFSSSVSTDWLFTLRPRIGYAWDRTLLYATGGLAVTKISFSQSYSDNVNFAFPPSTTPGGLESATGSKTVAGWTVGGGLEQALGNRWSVKAEYLYTQFSGFNTTGHLTDGGGGFANFANSVGQLSSHVVRAGINYKFGTP